MIILGLLKASIAMAVLLKDCSDMFVDFGQNPVVKNYNFMEKECKHIIDQLITWRMACEKYI